MINNNFYKSLYRLLKYANTQYEMGLKVDTVLLNETVFEMSKPAWYDLVGYTVQKELLSGIELLYGGNRVSLVNFNSVRITPEGMLYLKTNPEMQEMHAQLKMVEDVLPI